jgi:hypothetical protein
VAEASEGHVVEEEEREYGGRRQVERLDLHRRPKQLWRLRLRATQSGPILGVGSVPRLKLAVFQNVRQSSADRLPKNLSALKGEKVLRFCADQTLFAPPIPDEGTLAAIAGRIVEVCQMWRWL